MRALLFLLAAACAGLALAQTPQLQPRDDGFQVTKPAPGDTIAITEETYGRVNMQIEWTVPEAISERPVMLSLAQGDDLESMNEVEIISSDAENNGSLTWTVYLDDVAASGCNYSIYAKSWTDYAYSGYFTITNPEDSGLDPSWTCPVDVGRLRPSNGSYEEPVAIGNSEATTDGTSSDSSGDGASDASSSDNDNSGGGGVSTTTLAVAVAVPIVVLLVAFAVLIVLGVRRGWFLRKGERHAQTQQQSFGTERSTPKTMDMQEQGKDSQVRIGEMHGNDRRYQTEGNGIYQLYGSEGRR